MIFFFEKVKLKFLPQQWKFHSFSISNLNKNERVFFVVAFSLQTKCCAPVTPQKCLFHGKMEKEKEILW